MTQTTARIKTHGKHFEIMVDLDKALKYRKGDSSNVDFLETEEIFTDLKKGMRAAEKDLKEAFGTDDVNTIAGKIVKSGDVLVTQEHRDEERENQIKRVVDFLSRNAVDPQTGNPHTPDRIKRALEEAHVNIKKGPIDNQVKEIMEALSKVLPVKLETKRIKTVIPAIHTGKVYGLISGYKESENWLSNGDLEAILNVPAGMIIDFYEKLNSATHGSVVTEEIRE